MFLLLSIFIGNQFLPNCLIGSLSPPSDYGLAILKRLKVPKYGVDVCSSIVFKVLELEEAEVEVIHKNGIRLFFEGLSKTCLVIEKVEGEKDPIPSAKKVNTKGESSFHIACQKPTVEALDDEIDLLFNDPRGLKNINVTDNAGNSCLHDCAFHGKVDHIDLLSEFCCHRRRK